VAGQDAAGRVEQVLLATLQHGSIRHVDRRLLQWQQCIDERDIERLGRRTQVSDLGGAPHRRRCA